jgi:hypothetical protein
MRVPNESPSARLHRESDELLAIAAKLTEQAERLKARAAELKIKISELEATPSQTQ